MPAEHARLSHADRTWRVLTKMQRRVLVKVLTDGGWSKLGVVKRVTLRALVANSLIEQTPASYALTPFGREVLAAGGFTS